MTAEERRARILDHARTGQRFRVSDLVADLNVSGMTIRRDLHVLAQRGLIERVHGGGILRRPEADSAGEYPQPELPASLGSASDPPAAPSTNTGPGTSARPQIGIVVPASASHHDYFLPILAGARRVLDARAVRRALAVSAPRLEQEKALVHELLDSGCTGLLLTPSIPPGEEDPARIDWLLELPVPTVLVERAISSWRLKDSLPSVQTAHENGGGRAVWHLQQLGHRGVALAATSRSQTATRVINGWERAIDQFGLDKSSSPLVVRPDPHAWLSEDRNQILDELVRTQATAIILFGYQATVTLAHGARTRGWQIPEDLSVIAVEDEVADMTEPPLTAVSVPKDWVGQAATELLLELLASGGHSGPVRHIIVEPELVIRRSTTAPRTTRLA